MKIIRKALFLAVCGLISNAASRKVLTQTPFSGHDVEAPQVLETQFKFGTSDGNYYWLFDMTPPVLRAGWQTQQNANSQSLTWQINPASYAPNPRIVSTSTLQGTANTLALGMNRKPKSPSALGLALITSAPVIPAGPPAPAASAYDTPYSPTAKLYQYWAV